ncbi:hypothetical protein CHS0354_023695 [Potamilus streckersoni]|uniref:Uncharacterized protein n=1 Tax=Potamilus streckersoni TaxID=2493646 RepID=A0AAE0SBH6_9BIVA|nr:hypothetical protein CHS0354_023695 [Potamilus streckersoni]
MSETDDVDQLVDNDELDNASGLQTCSSTNREDESNRTDLEYVNPTINIRSNDTTNATKIHNQTELIDEPNSHPVEGIPALTNVVTNGNAETPPPESHPVYYSNNNGGAAIVQRPVVVTRSDGTRVIQTNQIAPQRLRNVERPLRHHHIKLLKIFSFVAIVLFFPLGVPALYLALQTKKEFEAGIMRCDLDLANKLAKRTERLIIFSFLSAMLVAVIVFALVERTVMSGDEDYWRNRSPNSVLTNG